MKHEAINSPVELLPFADLYVSPLNPRTVFSAEGIEALAENIRQLGLIQNLAGLRDEAGKVGIVAGGRRLRALELLQDDPRFATIPVKLAPDAATAEVWASSENHHREQPLGSVLQLSRWVRAAVIVVSDIRGHTEEGKRTFGASAMAAQ